ncbi:MAG: outer membrane protein assembly factor BamA [Dysgonamonadaceae bacterium]|jgi:outer membrane protein insertion porin family|nr:outer membrane protein assembly factor BamA [Dysgonamonadaceae bacterium]
MYKKFLLFCLGAFAVNSLLAQDTIPIVSAPELPVISYSLNNNKRYAIADIKVTGVENYGYEDYVLIGISGLAVGQKVSVPGDELTSAVKAFWKHGLFSYAGIYATKLTADSVWLTIALKPNPLISTINYHGVKKSEKEDLEGKIGMAKGSQLTPNLINRARKRIKDYFDEKGFSNAEITIRQYDDVANQGKSIMDITINKNEKTKVREIYINGNEELNYFDLRMAMKKTNSGFSLKKNPWLNIRKLFSTKKFVQEEYQNDLQNIIAKYNEKGFRDAEIVSDSVVMVDDKHVAVHIDVKEGNKYFIRNIKWVGNTRYLSDDLEFILNMNPGDIYNQKKLGERLQSDEDAVANIYYNNGYIFAQMSPVETYVENDSVDLEIRVLEGRQATINRVTINGNDRIYEDVIRRELLTKPGQLFSKDLLIRSAREIAQSGHFDPENMDINPLPNPETGTVDIQYGLTPKANDQVEFSAGWGPTGVIGRMSLKFSNFSFKNLIHPSTYKGIIPQGEGQTLTLSGQTNGRYYQSYSVSFMDPWLGGKRPNSFSLSAYYMVTTGVEDRYYEQMYSNPYYYSGYGSSYGSSYGGGYSDYGGVAYDENQSMKIFGLSAGYGKRLSWPDYLFNFMAELSYQRYMLKNWRYFVISNGNSNSLSLGLTLSRSSVDNPLYTRKGSQFTASVNLTPPYSAFSGKVDEAKANEWIEFHKWKFKGKIFIPLANPETVKRTPVLMSRIEYGFIGSYNNKKKTPFETFYMGGDGMTGYSGMYAYETIGLRGYGNGLISSTGPGYAYSRLALELRYPVLLEPTSTIYLLAFAEAGNAWTQISSFNPFDLKRSMGVGARIFLPMIGLMGIDWGYGFDSPYSGAQISGSQLHFILGQEF